MAAADSGSPLRVAYFAWRFPAVSQTFIQREIDALRRRDVTVDTFTLRPAYPQDILSGQDRRSFEATTSILPTTPLRVAAAHLRLLTHDPRAYAAVGRRAWARARRTGRWRKTTFYFVESILLARELTARGHRHLHVHFGDVGCDVGSLAAEYLRQAARHRGEKFTWTFTLHGPDELERPEEFDLAAKVSHADAVICISDYCRSHVVALAPTSDPGAFPVVHCGIPVDDWLMKRDEKSGPAKILTVGRAVPQKAQRVLLEAAAELVRRGCEFDLTVVGDGPLRGELEGFASAAGLSDRVHFAGAVGQDSIKAFFAEAQIFCLPSVAEGLPIVLMEAMAAGVAVVATKITAIPELVADGHSGVLVPPRDAMALADALQRLLGDLALRTSYAKAGIAEVRAEFEIDACADELVRVFQSVTRPSS
jgi:colanic acid/amylovoran biosynthesis glycosyltransferase